MHVVEIRVGTSPVAGVVARETKQLIAAVRHHGRVSDKGDEIATARHFHANHGRERHLAAEANASAYASTDRWALSRSAFAPEVAAILRTAATIPRH